MINETMFLQNLNESFIMKDIEELTDSELRQELKSHNVNPGPITDSTRNVYRKKLVTLIYNQRQNQKSNSRYDSERPLTPKSETPPTSKSTTPPASNSRTPPASKSKTSSAPNHDASTAVSRSVDKPNWSRILRTLLIGLLGLLGLIPALTLVSANKALLRGLIILTALSPIFYGIYRLVRFYNHRRNQESQKICDLVNEALELLQSPDNPKGLMPILHIRDTLLTPAERKTSKIHLWNKATKMIEEHESRVKVEIVNIDGVDFRAWKWIGSRKL